MFGFEAYSKDSSGKINKESVKVITIDGILGVYADSIKRHNFDTEEAVTVKIDFNSELDGILAIQRDSPYWAVPRFADELGSISKKTQGVLVKKTDGCFAAVVTVVGKEYKTDLFGKEGSLFSQTFSWYETSNYCDELLFVCGEGKNPYKLLHDCFKTASELLGNHCRMRENREYPELLEYLGWCSWDSMQIRVDEKGLKEKCEEFKQKNIPVKWAIIDDMWAEIRDFYGKEYNNFNEMVDLMHKSKLYSFEADPKRFPKGLENIVDIIHSYGMNVGIWYPTTGYWAGIDKEGDAFKKIGRYTIETSEGVIVPDFEPSMAYMYYKTIFERFREVGIDFIKIDNQALPSVHYKGMAPVGKTARGAANGTESAASEAFGQNIINCMGMSSEMMWNRSISGVSRCSNDFMPENKKWFAKHIMQCTYNGLMQGQLYYNDYDMWWTDDEQAKKNSLLRAVSGGPIYVSDKIGRTKKEILEPLILSDGRILRCDRCGIPTEDCLVKNPKKTNNIFKVQNIYKNYGILAVFNLNEEDKEVKGTVSPKDIYGLPVGEYAVYEHFSGELKVLSYDGSIDVTLKNNDEFKLYIFSPIKNGFAPIGRTDKFISPATIDYVYEENIVLKENGPYAYVKNGKLTIK